MALQGGEESEDGAWRRRRGCEERRRREGVREAVPVRGGARSGAGEGVRRESRGCEEKDRRERSGGGPPVCERKREERVADVAIGATWTGDVAENRGGFGLGGYFARFR